MTDPHTALRDDVRLLGELLGEILREHGGRRLFHNVELVRQLSKIARSGEVDAYRMMSATLDSMPIEDQVAVARAFSHFLNLANIAEQHHRIRRSREYERADPRQQKYSFEETFQSLLSEGISKEQLFTSICNQSVEIVFTAHPTEILRRTLIRKYNRIAELLAERDHPQLTTDELRENGLAIKREIAAIWLTEEVRSKKPTPLDEVRWGQILMEEVVWDVLPTFARKLDQALKEFTGNSLPQDAVPIKFGSWIGGDRDGNPNVTPEITFQACLLARSLAANLYMEAIDQLYDELSIAICNDELRNLVGSETKTPYRDLLKEVKDRLIRTQNFIETAGAPPARPYTQTGTIEAGRGAPVARPQTICWNRGDLLEPLQLCYRSLVESGASILAEGRLLDVIRRVHCFGLTLWKLDLRQEAGRHAEAVAAITGQKDYPNWSEEKKLELLLQRLQSQPGVEQETFSDPDVQDVLNTIRIAAQIGEESLGAYVISLARDPSDILAVELLKRQFGIRDFLRVVPLFEKIDDLTRAGSVIKRLLQIDWYKNQIGNQLEVMIGYSDSSKDGGILTAAWQLYQTQEALTEVCKDAGIHLTLFHGRGGTIGRGGGPTYLAISSQPPGSIEGRLRVTEQGEMLQAKFGLPGIAFRTLEVYTTATLRATVKPPPAPRENWRALMDKISESANQAYQDVLSSKEFMQYFNHATPAPEMSNLKIGSRPVRRTSGEGLGSLRAIPWQFAWTQNRLMLPAWLGVGESLSRLMEEGSEEELKQMRREWPFFQSALDLIEMVLAKAEPAIVFLYDASLVPEELRSFGRDLREKVIETIRAILTITGHEFLLQENSVLRRSIDVRNPYVDPINFIQVDILREIRRNGSQKLIEALLLTFNGIAAGMRNTG